MKLLILDLAETLLHGCETPLDREADFVIDGRYHIYVWPHLQSFLEYAFANFKVAIWTSASASYVTAVIKEVIPQQFELEFLWSSERYTRRKNLETWEEYWVKNLTKVKKKGYDLNSVLVVDDTPEKLSRNYGNYIRVAEYLGDAEDEELLLLPRCLSMLRDEENVRRIEKRFWRAEIAESIHGGEA